LAKVIIVAMSIQQTKIQVTYQSEDGTLGVVEVPLKATTDDVLMSIKDDIAINKPERDTLEKRIKTMLGKEFDIT